MVMFANSSQLLRNFDFQMVKPWYLGNTVQSYGVFLETNLLVKVFKSEL